MPDFKLSLRPSGTTAPPLSHRLPTTEGLEGWLAIGAEGPSLTLASAWKAPVAELRWQVDQAIRRARRALDLRGHRVVLETEGVPGDVAFALGLDLRRAFSTSAHALGPALDALAAREEAYRKWVNEDPSTRTSLQIAADVRQWAERRAGLEVEILDEEAIAREGLRLLAAVGQASRVSPPRLVLVRWTPPDEPTPARAPWMLLGKGVTFDTGGINVKPYESFVSHMRNDMAGAALAFHTFAHLVELGFPRPLALAIPTCENAVGEEAMRPGTVVESHKKKKVKIDHTDAEGRLILADALSYAEAKWAPERTWSFATLTTAALAAYGPYATPVHFAPPETERVLREVSTRSGEDLHFLPRRIWHVEANRDDEAELKNTARLPGYMPHAAGSRNAAHFLLHFTKAPLVHWDIFASAWNWAGDYPGTGFGATGAPLRTVIEGLEQLAAEIGDGERARGVKST
ncbi:MAG: leucyl aminopeptidase family protein [Deltaproteobacteria bacterium]|nr:leucyl aminopeptidase family protein [Deltaproteobacteria bacterium]